MSDGGEKLILKISPRVLFFLTVHAIPSGHDAFNVQGEVLSNSWVQRGILEPFERDFLRRCDNTSGRSSYICNCEKGLKASDEGRSILIGTETDPVKCFYCDDLCLN